MERHVAFEIKPLSKIFIYLSYWLMADKKGSFMQGET